jgi:hypothetical protein
MSVPGRGEGGEILSWGRGGAPHTNLCLPKGMSLSSLTRFGPRRCYLRSLPAPRMGACLCLYGMRQCVLFVRRGWRYSLLRAGYSAGVWHAAARVVAAATATVAAASRKPWPVHVALVMRLWLGQALLPAFSRLHLMHSMYVAATVVV